MRDVIYRCFEMDESVTALRKKKTWERLKSEGTRGCEEIVREEEEGRVGNEKEQSPLSVSRFRTGIFPRGVMDSGGHLPFNASRR